MCAVRDEGWLGPESFAGEIDRWLPGPTTGQQPVTWS